MIHGIDQPAWPFGYRPTLEKSSNKLAANTPRPVVKNPRNTVHEELPDRNANLAVLIVNAMPRKSRVETQIPIKMSLSPLPEGVTKLHLPSHTISKPKLLAKPTPPKSADMLELYVTLVCTSAMQDPAKLNKAFTKAAAQSRPQLKQGGIKGKENGNKQKVEEEAEQLSMSCDSIAIEEEDQPLNGGEVHICAGCITRERKRAARKKSKKPEEEEPWQKDEAKRIIVFNTTEVKEWETPAAVNPVDGQSESPDGPQEVQVPVPEDAMQIDIPMRIACYCRHQHEKLGFR